MKRLKKEQAFIFILISLLVLATLGSLALNHSDPYQSTALRFTPFGKSPAPDRKDYPTPPWQLKNSDIELAKGLVFLNFNLRSPRTPNNERHILVFYQYEPDRKPKEIPSYVYIPDTIFKRTNNRQACHHLDIPPPLA